jgi:hypothetical protein
MAVAQPPGPPAPAPQLPSAPAIGVAQPVAAGEPGGDNPQDRTSNSVRGDWGTSRLTITQTTARDIVVFDAFLVANPGTIIESVMYDITWYNYDNPELYGEIKNDTFLGLGKPAFPWSDRWYLRRPVTVGEGMVYGVFHFTAELLSANLFDFITYAGGFGGDPVPIVWMHVGATIV